jgi:ATP-dependent Clp protease ATP-binding subunit ClpA
MTSNLGSDLIQLSERGARRWSRKVHELAGSDFRPEFLNRIDDTHHLPPAVEGRDVKSIVPIQLAQREDAARRAGPQARRDAGADGLAGGPGATIRGSGPAR